MDERTFQQLVLDELKASRDQQTKLVDDIEARVKVLERKSDTRSAIVSAATSIAVALAAALSGCNI